MAPTTAILDRFFSLKPGTTHTLEPGRRAVTDVVEARCAVCAQLVTLSQYILDDEGDHSFFPDVSMLRVEPKDWILLEYQGEGALRRMSELQLKEPKTYGCKVPVIDEAVELIWFRSDFTCFGAWLFDEKYTETYDISHGRPLGPRTEPHPRDPIAVKEAQERNDLNPRWIVEPEKYDSPCDHPPAWMIPTWASLPHDPDDIEWWSNLFPELDEAMFIVPRAYTPAGEEFLSEFDVSPESEEVLYNPELAEDVETLREIWHQLPDADADDAYVGLRSICGIYLRFSDGGEFYTGGDADEFHPALQRGMARLQQLCANESGEDLRELLLSIGSEMDLGAK